MGKFELKRKLLVKFPHCPGCHCKLILVKGNPIQMPNNAAMLMEVEGGGVQGLICFQCRRIEAKRNDFIALPFRKRLARRFDRITGILTWAKRTRGRINKFIYVHVKGGKLTGKP